MSFFSKTVRKHFQIQLNKLMSEFLSTKKLIFTIPGLPENTTLEVARDIDAACSKDGNIKLNLKIASNLLEEWSVAGKEEADRNDWSDALGNLTRYRSMQSPDEKALYVIVLFGVDRVMDSASLADFHTCTPEAIWHNDMKQSFSEWIIEKLQSGGFVDLNHNEIKSFDEILKPIMNTGQGDLLQIGNWLESINIANCTSINDVRVTMLSSLQQFGLPILARYQWNKSRRKLEIYIIKAIEFYNYSMFIESKQRDKALKTLGAIQESMSTDELSKIPFDEEGVHDSYPTKEEYIDGLQKYIDSDDQLENRKLLQCDFVVILDKVLGFRTSKVRRSDSARKLSGDPIEVFLTSLWIALQEFHKAHKSPMINSICIVSSLFRHDIETGDDTAENHQQAYQYLRRLIGGIDSFFAKHINVVNTDGTEVEMQWKLLDPEISCRYTSSAEPVFEYCIDIHSDSGKRQSRYGWRLPEHSAYRLSADLLFFARRSLEQIDDPYVLPVFHLPYYEELMQSSSSDEVRRVLLSAIRDECFGDRSATNLYSGEWTKQEYPLSDAYKALAEEYHKFIDKSCTDGIFTALLDNNAIWPELRRAYSETCETALSLPSISYSSLIGMLVRMFLVIEKRESNLRDTWYSDSFEESGLATILHPAVLEMLQAQTLYLSKCFNYLCNKEINSTESSGLFRLAIWRSYIELTRIQSPLNGILCNQENNLDTNVRGESLIHRIGTIQKHDSPLSTRSLLSYDSDTSGESDLSDSEMFRESSESKLLQRLMTDYLQLHPHARDGLSIAIFRNKDFQPVIAAVNSYLKIIAKDKEIDTVSGEHTLRNEISKAYSFSLRIFTSADEEADIITWIHQWSETWEAAEVESKYNHYCNCKFSVSHKIVTEKDLCAYQRLIMDNLEADIAVMYDFVGAGSGISRFENVGQFDVTSRDLKFPILEKACCTISDPAEKFRRRRIVSNRQFRLGSLHSSILHSLKTGICSSDTIVVGCGDFTPWRRIVDCLHTKVGWVICVDPNIDDRLIKEPVSMGDREREVIGFGSGVGTHGEDNYTVSTERFYFTDLKYRLKYSVSSLYSDRAAWNNQQCLDVAEGLLGVANELSGLSIVRATGVGDQYIRDFMAYALTRKLLKPVGSPLCEFVVSLDAYRHWFDLAYSQNRPDLLWIQARILDTGKLSLEIHLVECKMGNESEDHIRKGMMQIDNGLRVLTDAFEPRRSGDAPKSLKDEKPDSRYWWMQIHRLIASKIEVSRSNYPKVIEALERLAEGDFEISWSASVFAYWINKDNSVFRIKSWQPTNCSPSVTANVYCIGGGATFRIATDNSYSIDWDRVATQGVERASAEEDSLKVEAQLEVVSNSEKIDAVEIYKPEISTNVEDIYLETPSNDKEYLEENERKITTLMPEHESSTSLHNRVFLGNAVRTDRAIYWEFGHQDLANRHMLLFGASGQGKTYAIQAMLCELSRFKQNNLIIDYTNGFLPNHLEKPFVDIMNPEQHVVRQKPLPINPFLPQETDSGGIVFSENANSIAKRIAGLFNSVYNVGDQQYSVLHTAIMDGVENWNDSMNLDQMLSIIESMTEEKKYRSSAQTLYNKLRPFVLDHPFSYGEGSFDWDSLFTNEDPLCNIFQLAGMDSYSGRLITEFILWDLYGHLQSKGKKTDPKVIVLDEVQNLDHKEGSPLSKYLREGRKFGLSLILATQTMSNMKKDERDRMFNAEHKLFFKPATTEVKAFADIAALSTHENASEWIDKLSSLRKGECFSIGPTLDSNGTRLVSRSVKIRIAALEDRSFGE